MSEEQRSFSNRELRLVLHAGAHGLGGGAAPTVHCMGTL
jgi:hypothetical protein